MTYTISIFWVIPELSPLLLHFDRIDLWRNTFQKLIDKVGKQDIVQVDYLDKSYVINCEHILYVTKT